MIRITTIALLLTMMLPVGMKTAVPAFSVSVGLMGVALFWIAAALAGPGRAYMFRRRDGYFMALPIGIVAMLALHLVISTYFVEGADYGRFAGSCLILMLVLTGAYFASDKLLQVPDRTVVRAVDFVLILLGLFGVAGAVGAPSIGPPITPKPVVVFSEPSHWGLAMLPMLLFRASIARRSTQILLIVAFIAVAAALQNLTTIAGILAVAALLLRQTRMLLILAPLAGVGALLDLTYYAERLTLSSSSNNLSTLVFLQGWENAYLNFFETSGFGVGFQQFGTAGSTGEVAQKITQMMGGSSLSLLDGGTTASKLIGELGVFGILIILSFMRVALRSLKFIRRQQALPPAERDTKRIFFCAVLTTYVIELFMRGVGYFSAGGFLAVVALLSLGRLRPPQRVLSPGPTIPIQTAVGVRDALPVQTATDLP